MSKFYSRRTRGFYARQIHDNIPDDAIEISDERWRELLQSQSEGKQIVAGDGGEPITVNRVATAEQILGSVTAERGRLLDETDWLVNRHRDESDAGRPTTLTRDQFIELITYRQALRDLPQSQGYPNIQLPPKPSFV